MKKTKKNKKETKMIYEKTLNFEKLFKSNFM